MRRSRWKKSEGPWLGQSPPPLKNHGTRSTVRCVLIALVAGHAAFGADTPKSKAEAVSKPVASRYTEQPKGEISPAMLRMQEAGRVEGQRGSLTFFRWSGNPPKLSHLGLWGPKVSNEIIALITTLPDLSFVSVYETGLSDEGVVPLTKLPNLRFLSITPIIRYEKVGFGAPQWSYPFMKPVADRPRVTGMGLRTIASITTLEGLDLLDAKLASSDLAVLASLPKLGSLSLPNVLDDEAVRHLQACRRLTNLTLGHRAISATELECLAAWKSLRKLVLTHTQLSDAALQALSKLETVQSIELIDCGLTDERLQHLHGSPKLKELSLVRNEINGPGLAHLVKLNLTTLDLGYNNIRDETLLHVLPLTSLENLWLEYCIGVTDQGIHSGALQKMTHLKQLRLRGMKKVTDATLDDLMKFGHLGNLTIRETGISWESVDRIKQAMPKTVVFK
ncbi:MAG: hypothetical protein EBS05_04825 [Proteobacteria bacterium]|nr:hypothetical protein [Pseudomonadota bacterium]NDF00820.1 hypothetical protein [Verrucomicrobiota bacterium]